MIQIFGKYRAFSRKNRGRAFKSQYEKGMFLHENFEASHFVGVKFSGFGLSLSEQ